MSSAFENLKIHKFSQNLTIREFQALLILLFYLPMLVQFMPSFWCSEDDLASCYRNRGIDHSASLTAIIDKFTPHYTISLLLQIYIFKSESA